MKCKNCGEETENTCTSMVDGSVWYKFRKCFEKEQNEGCIAVIVIMGIAIALLVFGGLIFK